MSTQSANRNVAITNTDEVLSEQLSNSGCYRNYAS